MRCLAALDAYAPFVRMHHAKHGRKPYPAKANVAHMTDMPGAGRGGGTGRIRAALGPQGALGQLARFSAVGVVTALIDFVVYNGALALFGTRATPAVLLSSTLGFLTSMLTSYVGNRNFTFRARHTSERFLPYAAVSLSGFFIENATLYLVWQVFIAAGVNHGYLAANVARAIAALPALVWTFLLYRSVVFVPPGQERARAPSSVRLPPTLHRLLYAQPLVPLAGLLAVGIALRLPFLLSLPLATQEWQAAHLAEMLAAGHGLQGHPISLMAVLLTALFRITGPSFSEPRVLGALLSAAAVAATFFLGRALWRSTAAGLLAALAVAANGPSVLASHVAVSAVAAPFVIAVAAYATLRGLDGDARMLFLAAALWLVALAAGGWGFALLPGTALVFAGGLAALPVPHRPQVSRLAGLLAIALTLALIVLGRPVLPGHPITAATALVRTAGDLTLVPAAVQPALGAAVLVALIASLGYSLRSRRGRIVAIPLLGALAAGPFLGAANGGGAVAILPLFAVLAAGTARWGARRLARHAPIAVYTAVGALTAAVIGFAPLLGLGSHYGHLLRADQNSPPSPQIVAALRKVGVRPQPNTLVLVDSHGYRAGVVGWVLTLRGYNVRFVGNPYNARVASAGAGSLASAFLDPNGPATAAAFVVTAKDYGVLESGDQVLGAIGPVRHVVAGGAYVVGEIWPVGPPQAAPGGVITWTSGTGPMGYGVGAGPSE